MPMNPLIPPLIAPFMMRWQQTQTHTHSQRSGKDLSIFGLLCFDCTGIVPYAFFCSSVLLPLRSDSHQGGCRSGSRNSITPYQNATKYPRQLGQRLFTVIHDSLPQPVALQIFWPTASISPSQPGGHQVGQG